MFQNQRFITRGVLHNIPRELSAFLWRLVRSMPPPKDYLQIFTLSSEGGLQKITHTQEIPKYQKHYLLKTEKPVNEKVFVIDDKTHTTMLLSSEY